MDRLPYADDAEPREFRWVSVPVPVEFRERVLAAYPVLAEEEPLRRLAEYFLFTHGFDELGPWDDAEAQGRIIAPQASLTTLLGLPKHAGVGNLLADFSERVWPLEVSGYSVLRGEARTVVRYPAEVEALLPGSRLGEGELVDFVTGKPSHLGRRLTERLNQAAMTAQAAPPEGDPRRPLWELLSTQAPHALNAQIRKNWEAAWEVALGLPSASASYAFVLLRLIKAGAAPVYSTVARSSRLYALGPSINGLPREVRKALLSGGLSLDARACQLAILTRLWKLEGLRPLLDKGDPIKGGAPGVWAILLRDCNLPTELKPALKSALYAVAYGAGRDRIRKTLLSGGLSPEQVRRFTKHPAIAELLTAAKREKAAVIAAGGAEDAFGTWLPLLDPNHPEQHAGGLLSRVMQSWEMRLMLSLVPTLRDLGRPEAQGLTVLSWLHDGLTVYVPRAERRMSVWIRLSRVFDREAKTLGFDTCLEFDDAYLTPPP